MEGTSGHELAVPAPPKPPVVALGAPCKALHSVRPSGGQVASGGQVERIVAYEDAAPPAPPPTRPPVARAPPLALSKENANVRHRQASPVPGLCGASSARASLGGASMAKVKGVAYKEVGSRYSASPSARAGSAPKGK